MWPHNNSYQYVSMGSSCTYIIPTHTKVIFCIVEAGLTVTYHYVYETHIYCHMSVCIGIVLPGDAAHYKLLHYNVVLLFSYIHMYL